MPDNLLDDFSERDSKRWTRAIGVSSGVTFLGLGLTATGIATFFFIPSPIIPAIFLSVGILSTAAAAVATAISGKQLHKNKARKHAIESAELSTVNALQAIKLGAYYTASTENFAPSSTSFVNAAVSRRNKLPDFTPLSSVHGGDDGAPLYAAVVKNRTRGNAPLAPIMVPRDEYVSCFPDDLSYTLFGAYHINNPSIIFENNEGARALLSDTPLAIPKIRYNIDVEGEEKEVDIYFAQGLASYFLPTNDGTASYFLEIARRNRDGIVPIDSANAIKISTFDELYNKHSNLQSSVVYAEIPANGSRTQPLQSLVVENSTYATALRV